MFVRCRLGHFRDGPGKVIDTVIVTKRPDDLLEYRADERMRDD